MEEKRKLAQQTQELIDNKKDDWHQVDGLKVNVVRDDIFLAPTTEAMVLCEWG